MDKKFIEIEEKRKNYYEKYKVLFKKGLIRGIPILIIVIAAFFIFDTNPAVFIIGFILMIWPGTFMIKAYNIAHKYKDIIKNDFIKLILEDKFEDTHYDRHGSISQSLIDSTGMVKRPDKFSGEDYIRGKIGSVSFEASDVTLRERQEHVDSEGRRTVTYPVYFKGRWYVLNFPKKLKGTIKVGESYPVNRRGLEKFETESIMFNKKFRSFTSDKQFAFYMLNPLIIENLLKLERKKGGSIYFYYSGNQLHIGVNDRKDYLEMKISTPINESTIKDFEQDFDIIPAIIRDLKLNSSKFKKLEE